MLKKILNIGVSRINDETLNRKIRISNLIAVISLINMVSFLPLAIYLKLAPALYLVLFFSAASLSNFILHFYKKHSMAFYIYTISGFIYFICATLTFGLVSNLHFFMLIMCMIAVVIFDNKIIVKIFIAIAVITFFILRWYMKDRVGFINSPPELKPTEEIVGTIILFLLFIVTSIFFIFFKNENLTFQKAVLSQKEIIEEKNKDITASITYAKRLQEAILPSKALIDKAFPEAFIFYRPKDIVAGDFYWMETLSPPRKDEEGCTLFAAADCTGHGVPGAMVSVVCSNALNRAVKEFGISDPGKILDKVRELVVETFEKSEDDVKDGMDISLFNLNDSRTELKWAGANNPMLVIRNDKIIEYKPNKQPIGKVDNVRPYTTHIVALEKDDIIYTFTDGFNDQFGGPKGKKFKYKQLQEILIANNILPMEEQKLILEKKFEEWRGYLEQVDDVLLMGIRI